jgi:hypothetical protein
VKIDAPWAPAWYFPDPQAAGHIAHPSQQKGQAIYQHDQCTNIAEALVKIRPSDGKGVN